MSAAAIVALVLGAVGITGSLLTLAFTLGRRVGALLELVHHNTKALEILRRRVAHMDRYGSQATQRAAAAAELAADRGGQQLWQGAVIERRLEALHGELETVSEAVGNGDDPPT